MAKNFRKIINNMTIPHLLTVLYMFLSIKTVCTVLTDQFKNFLHENLMSHLRFDHFEHSNRLEYL